MNSQHTPLFDRKQCAVQSKVPCVFKTDVQSIESSKRSGQNYKVVASKLLSEDAISSNVITAYATEKIDGTCCYVGLNNSHVVLFARFDRKPNKQSSKRFKSHLIKVKQWAQKESEGEIPKFKWKYPEDFKPCSEYWIPAKNVETTDLGLPCPDDNGHTPGWVPIFVNPSQYCWHQSVIDEKQQLVLILKPSHAVQSKYHLVLTLVSISSLQEKTLELIGTNINGNPYHLGTKKNPFHVLIEHGSILVKSLPSDITYDGLKHWFANQTTNENKIEGLVWHCLNGQLYKLHRHHLNLPWPLKHKSTDCTVPHVCIISDYFSRGGCVISSNFNLATGRFSFLTGV